MTTPHAYRPRPRARPETPPTLGLVEGLAMEAALLDSVAVQGSASDVQIWHPADRALVVPRSFARGREFVRASALVERIGYRVVLRQSGGDVVPQAPGMCNIAVALSTPSKAPEGAFSVDAAYQMLCIPLVRWLCRHGLAAGVGPVSGAFCDGRYNVTIGGRKVAGTAQRRRQTPDGGQSVLAHAAFMVDVDIEELVNVANVFYRLRGLEHRFAVASHVTLHGAQKDAAGACPVTETPMWGLLELYRHHLSVRAKPMVGAV